MKSDTEMIPAPKSSFKPGYIFGEPIISAIITPSNKMEFFNWLTGIQHLGCLCFANHYKYNIIHSLDRAKSDILFVVQLVTDVGQSETESNISLNLHSK